MSVSILDRVALTLVYDLYPDPSGLFLVNPYAVKLLKGELTHVQCKVYTHTVEGYGFTLNKTEQRLFYLIELIQVPALFDRFKVYQKKAKTLDDLLKDKKIKGMIVPFVDTHLDEILGIIYDNQYSLTFELSRKVLVSNFLVETNTKELEPLLSFERAEDQVIYKLRLKEGEETWQVMSRDVLPVCNHPAWIVADYRLYRVAHINGNMVKPFQKKEVVTIPPTSFKKYFQTFVLKIASRVDIDAEGFEINTENTLAGCSIEAVQNLFNDQWGLTLNMKYSGVVFGWKDQRLRNSSIEFEGDEVSITRVERDTKAEEKYVQKLKKLGLSEGRGSYFHLSEDESEGHGFTMLEWLSSHFFQLEKLGFEVLAPTIQGSRVCLEVPDLSLDLSPDNDWFDLYAVVTIGPFKIAFVEFRDHIINEDPIYKLPDGSVFIIPNEWFNKYQDLCKFATREGEDMRILKSQFTVLESSGINVPTVDQNTEEIKLPQGLQATLRPYQKDGARWLISLFDQGLGACLADDMGLGKTLQSITLLLHAKQSRTLQTQEAGDASSSQLDLFGGGLYDESTTLRALIVLPASLIFNWQSEIRKFAPSLFVYRHVGPKRHRDVRLIEKFDVILTTYQTALRDIEILQQLKYGVIILDESQQIKNRSSKIFKALTELDAEGKISLSGTPIENSLADLWSQMQFINPELLGSFSFFKDEFIVPIERAGDELAKSRLREIVNPFLLRRTKEDVVKDLPPLSTTVVYSEMSERQKELYEREKSAARNVLLENYDPSNPSFKLTVLQTLSKLRQIANHPSLIDEKSNIPSSKFKDVISRWEEICRAGHKVLFFSSFVKYLDLFKREFEKRGVKYCYLTGQLTQSQRTREIKTFEESDAHQTFLISLKAGGVGLNLTAADYVFVLDPWWNPTTEQQAVARAHRIGQTRNVFALRFITTDTIEEKIIRLQDKKKKLAADILGVDGSMGFSQEDISILLE